MRLGPLLVASSLLVWTHQALAKPVSVRQASPDRVEASGGADVVLHGVVLHGVVLHGVVLHGDAPPAASLERIAEGAQSVSCGSTNRGALSNATMLPTQGSGFVMAEPWRSRGTRYGTSELVALVTQSSAAVAALYRDSQLSVADISLEHGGPIAQHRSHQSGRDVDLIYYAMDAAGRPFYPDSNMAYYNGRGRATYAQSPRFVRNIPERYFDLARNWALVKSMMLSSQAKVEHIFVSPRIKRWLMRYAIKTLETKDILKMAARVLHAPMGVKGHNDHMHVRIACSKEDIRLGRCRQASATPPRHSRRWYRKVRCPRASPLALALPRS